MEAPKKVQTPDQGFIHESCQAFLEPRRTRALQTPPDTPERVSFARHSTDSKDRCTSYCEIQSGLTTTDETVVEESGERQEVVTFNDKSMSVKVEASPIEDESMYDGFSANVDLATYLARPVLIQSLDWLDNTVLTGAIIKPWSLYFNNDSIKRKLQNYAFLACNLKVKIVINASPFYYGYAFATYRPYSSNDAGSLVDSYTYYGATMAATCRQRIDILPAKSQGGEMLLPYINVRNWMRIGKLSDFEDMGTIHIWSHDVLKFANAAAGPSVTIQVFAWAEDVKVSGPTSQLPLQSGCDEYEETGPISGMASNVASLAGAAEDVLPAPFKPFAKATEIGASAVSSIASLFGFTNVPVLDDVSAFKNLPFHAMASTQISVPFEKLTLDPKNELTVDNRVAGGNGVDELAIPYLCGKRNILSLPNWTATAVPGDILAEINVSPIIATTRSGFDCQPSIGQNSTMYTIPMTLVARCFKFWRGTMVYRFKFICSQYHRGRVTIMWDPAHGTSADFNYTENYSRVVDISEEQEIEVRVPFMQPYPYLETRFNDLGINVTTPAEACSTYNEDRHNGRLIVKVLTKQTSPVATADILMYTEVRLEDADFANPVDPQFFDYTRTSYLPIQSGEEVVVSDNIAKMPIKQNPNLHKIYNGEAVFSMRSLFRRRTYYRTITPISNTTGTLYQYRGAFSRRPTYYGFDVSGSNVANEIIGASTSRFNYVNEPLQCLFEPCFVGVRGSQNYEINMNTPGEALDTLAVARYIDTVNFNSAFNHSYTTSTSADYKMRNAMSNTRLLAQTGCALTNMRTQTGLQVQVPMYSRFRFLGTKPTLRNDGIIDDGSNEDNMVISFRCVPTSGQNPVENSIDLYTSIGTDYQLLHFVNVPTFWMYGTIPNAA